ncbi:MAG TPA: sugar ABC transporter substrate-binding protein [Clostridiaceae bacterium]|nr:sugar ABC transporter substrate-binding protein [Clostridiaceae bacterium]
MKKTKTILSILLVCLLMLSLVACGSKSSKEDDKDKADKVEETEEVKDDAEEEKDDAEEAAEEEKDDAEEAAEDDSEIFIGLSMPTFAEERWVYDTNAIQAYCEEKGYKLVHAVADGDSNKQKEQCATMITQGIDALILAPNDGDAAATIVEEAKDAGVYVVSYDRLVTGTDLVDVYITFDSWYMGEINGKYIVDNLEAKFGEVKGNVVLLKGDPGDSNAPQYFGGAYQHLEPYIESGAIHVISENDCMGWKPEEATKHVENAMSIADAEGISIDAVLAPNDGTAGGVIAALGDDLAKETIITGMDAEVAAVQRILAGTQSMTSWGDTREMGMTAVDVAATLIAEGAYATETTEKGTDADGNEIDVPSVRLPAVFIDENNANILIEEGYHSEEDYK